MITKRFSPLVVASIIAGSTLIALLGSQSQSLAREVCRDIPLVGRRCVWVPVADPNNGGDGDSTADLLPSRPTGKFILNSLSRKCIDVAGAPGNTNGARLQLWNCEASGRNADNGSTTDQQWVLTQNGFIRNTLSGKCIDVAGAPGNTNGAPLQLWDCEQSGRNPDNGSTTDQQWVLTQNGFIRNTLSGKCIDVAGAPGNTNGAPLQLWDCEQSGRNPDNGSTTDQQWAY